MAATSQSYNTPTLDLSCGEYAVGEDWTGGEKRGGFEWRRSPERLVGSVGGGWSEEGGGTKEVGCSLDGRLATAHCS